MTLEIASLSVAFPGCAAPVVDDVSFRLTPQERATLAGESGCGKTVLALALMGLLPRNARVTGQAALGEWDLLDAAVARRLRGKEVAMCWSNAERYFNPVMAVGPQIEEAYLQHHPGRRREAREKAEELLRAMGFVEPKRLWKTRPFQLSGGMNQRAMIAMSIINDPRLLLADEPTRGLDDDNWERVAECLFRWHSGSMLIITHDLRLAARAGGTLHLMRYGRLVASGPCGDILEQPPAGYARLFVESGTAVIRGEVMGEHHG